MTDLDDLIEELLNKPCWIVDILPERVPENSAGQYFAADRYFTRPDRLKALYRKFAELLIKLNCYYDMAVTFDWGANWEKNPDPEDFADRLESAPMNTYLRVIFEAQRAMLDLDLGDTNMTLYDPDSAIQDMVRKLAQAEGLFVWGPVEND